MAVTVVFLLFAPAKGYAACMSPAAPDGAKEWFSADNNYKYCIGSTWVAAAKGDTLTSCSTAGQWDWDAGGFYKMCNGTNWIKMGCFAGGGSSGGGHPINASASVGGYNWYAAFDTDENCDTVCTTRGGCNLTGILNYAGSAGTNANCQAVLDGVFLGAGTVASSSAYSTGCGGGSGRYRQTGTTTCAATGQYAVRACSCNNATAAVASQVCTASATQVAITTPRRYEDSYYDGTYVYGASIHDGLYIYSFNGSSFTQVASYNTSGNANGVTAYGGYVFVADGALLGFTWNGTTLTYKTSIAGNFQKIWNDGTYLYASNRENSFKAYTFNGTAFTEVASYPLTTYESIVQLYKLGSNLYIVHSNSDTAVSNVRVLQFNGSSFTELTNAGTRLADATSITGNGTYLYTYRKGGLRAYTFNGTSFTQVGNTSSAIPGAAFYASGDMVLLAAGSAGLNVMSPYLSVTSFDGTNFVLQGSQAASTTLAATSAKYNAGYIIGSASNFGSGSGAGGLFAMTASLSSCGAVGGGCASLGSCSTAGQIDYDSGGSLVKQCDGSNWYALDSDHVSLGGGSDSTAPVWVSPAAGTALNVTASTAAGMVLSATDNSGIARFYRYSGPSWAYVSSSDGKILAAPPLAGAGCTACPITVRAYDLAGNYADRAFTINVSGGKVLCTYYNSRGMLPDEILEGDFAYSDKVHPLAGRAYRAWANPMIEYIKKHEGGLVDKVGFFLVKSWANEMAYRTGHGGEHNMAGWLLSEVGEPLHYLAGHFIPETEEEQQIRQAWEARRSRYASTEQ